MPFESQTHHLDNDDLESRRMVVLQDPQDVTKYSDSDLGEKRCALCTAVVTQVEVPLGSPQRSN